MRSCQEFQEILSAWLDGEATGEETLQLEEHLQSCATCAQMREDLTQLSDRVRDAQGRSPEILTATSSQLAQAALRAVPHRGEGLLQSARARVAPSLGVTAVTVLLLHVPQLFVLAWPLAALVLYRLGFRKAQANYDPSLRLADWFRATLKPLAFSLGLLQFLPAAGVLAEQPDFWATAIAAGPSLALLTVLGVLMGMTARLKPDPSLPRVPALTVLLAALAGAGTGLAAPSLAGAAALLPLLGGLAVAVRKLQGSLPSDNPDHWSSLVPKYSPGLAAVDSTILCVPALAALSGGTIPLFSNALWVLTAGLWLAWVRIPLASLLVLARGRAARLVLLPLVVLVTMVGTFGAEAWLQATAPAAAVGLLLAYFETRPSSSAERSQARRHLAQALLDLVTIFVLAGGVFVAATPLWPEPAEVGAIVAAHPLPDPRLEESRVPPQVEGNGFQFLVREYAVGLDASTPFESDSHSVREETVLNDWRLNRAVMERRMGYLRLNLRHLRQALQAPRFVIPRYIDQSVGERLAEALQTQSLGEEARGNLDGAVDAWVERLNFRVRCQSQYGASAVNADLGRELPYLRGLLWRQELTASQCRRLLKVLEPYQPSLEMLRDHLDSVYAGAVWEERYSRDWAVPRRFHRFQLQKLTRTYLPWRAALKSEKLSPALSLEGPLAHWIGRLTLAEHSARESMTDFELLQGWLGLELYRAEHGVFPDRLEQLRGTLPHPPVSFMGGQLDYSRTPTGFKLAWTR